jgi:hypothetical protein
LSNVSDEAFHDGYESGHNIHEYNTQKIVNALNTVLHLELTVSQVEGLRMYQQKIANKAQKEEDA